MKFRILAVFVVVFVFLSVSSFSEEGGMGVNPPSNGDPGSGETPDECTYCCQDMTPYGRCSEDLPLYCDNGALKHNCSFCGCEQGYECADNGYCIPSLIECEGGTLSGSCSMDMPLYCDNGELVDNCFVCGCNEGEDCLSDGTCHLNHAPVIVSIGEIGVVDDQDVSFEIQEGETLEFQIVAVDEDDDPLTYYATNKPGGSTFDQETGLFSWTTGYETIERQFYVSFLVIDSPVSGNSKTTDQNVWIYVGDVNRVPVIGLAEEFLMTDENVLLEFNLQAEDPDGDDISYYVEVLPDGAEFNQETGNFSWIPEFGQEGNYELNFIISDGVNDVTKKITITVGNINRPPKSEISHPLENQEFLNERNILFSGADSYDLDGEELTYIWDFGDGEAMATENSTTTHVYQNPGTYNVSLTTSDGEMYDTDTITILIKKGVTEDSDDDGVEDSIDRCPDTPPLKKVNVYGCSLPKYTEFENNLTTDFSGVDLKNATNVTIGIPEKGMVEFRKNTLDLVGKDLNKYVEIGDANITVESKKIPELNKSAVITFYNVTIRDPVMLKDEIYCPDCKIISYVNKTFSFSVPHFTTYSLMAWASYSGYCGDGMCSLYESCQECKEDCGECGKVEKPGVCEELWVCSAWSECNELNLRTRECMDANVCGLQTKKPAETTECGKEQDYSYLVFFGIILMVLVSVYLLTEVYKKRRESKKMDRFELERFVKGYMYRGYTKSEIGRILKSEGYAEKEINEVLEEVEKEIF